MDRMNYKISVRRRIRAVLTFLALLVSAIVTRTAAAQPHGGIGYVDMLLRGLSLTQEQVSGIQTLVSEQETAIHESRDAVRAARDDLLAYLKGGGSDSEQIQLLISTLTSAEAAEETLQAAVFVSAYALLTEEQKETLAALSTTPPGGPRSMSVEELTDMRDRIAAEGGEGAEGLSQVIENFSAADVNQDGLLTPDEFRTYAETNGIEMPRPDQGGGRPPEFLPPPGGGSEGQSTGTPPAEEGARRFARGPQMP